jgi:hypothetical protein
MTKEGGSFRQQRLSVERTADPSTALLMNNLFYVHYSLNLPQASLLLGMTKGKTVLPLASEAG